MHCKVMAERCYNHKGASTNLVFLDNLPAPAGVRVGRYPLKDDILSPIEQGPVSQVGVASDPAAVGCAPIHVAGL